MRSKTARINVANLRKFLARRKVQHVAKALKVINVFKSGAKESRYSDNDSEKYCSVTYRSDGPMSPKGTQRETASTMYEGGGKIKLYFDCKPEILIVLETIDLRAIIEEGHEDDFGKDDITRSEDDITRSEDEHVLPVKRVNIDSSAVISGPDDYIDAFKETETKPEKKREPAK